MMQGLTRRPAPDRLHGLAVAGLLIAAMQAPLGSTMIAVALPPLSASVGVNLAFATSLLVTSYLMVSMAGQSPGGKLGDVLGHAHAVKIGMLLYASGALLGLASNGIGLLTAARCIMALGGALVLPATLAIFRVYIPRERQGRVFGMYGAIMSLAAAVGPPLGGEIVGHFGWRAIFLAHLPPLAIAALLAFRRPPPAQAAARKPFGEFLAQFDWLGTLLLGIAVALLVVASKTAGLERAIALAVTLSVVAAFVRWELRAPSPVLDPRLFRYRDFRVGTSVIALQNFAMYGTLFQLPQYFHEVHAVPPTEIGRYLFLMMLAMFIASAVGGRLTDRIGCRATALAASAPLLAGSFWIANLGAFEAPREAALPLLLLGMGIGLMSAPTQAAVMSAVPPERAGMAAGGSSTMRYLGSTLTILLLSGILGGQEGQSVTAHETAAHFFAFATLLAALTGLALPPRVPPAARRQAD